MDKYSLRFDILRKRFDEFLLNLTGTWNFPEPLNSSVRYCLFPGGKRIRPVLLLDTYETFVGKVDEGALLFAAAVEVLHTYSLVHDDLPCMDNDDYRRGKLTCHKVFGEDIAVLTGDALLNLAYELVFKSIDASENRDGAIAAGRTFSSLVGGVGLIGGQIDDLAFTQKDAPDFSDIESIFQRKTCNLIIAAVKCGALLGGASMVEVDRFSEFAYNFGFAFQIADDLLDGDVDDSCSVLRVCGKTAARELLSDYTLRAVSALEKTERNVEFLTALALAAEKRME